MMHLITAALGTPKKPLEAIVLRVDRHKLARRRWRACAADGVDFGFDVPEALHHGDCIFKGETKAYYIEQEPEACLLVEFSTSEASARIGWMIGNLHFKAAFTDSGILVQDDLAVRQMLEREQIDYQQVQRIFQPAKQVGHSHDHSHSHE